MYRDLRSISGKECFECPKITWRVSEANKSCNLGTKNILCHECFRKSLIHHASNIITLTLTTSTNKRPNALETKKAKKKILEFLLKQLLRSTYFSIFHLSESSPGLSSVGRRAVSAEYSKNRWRLSWSVEQMRSRCSSLLLQSWLNEKGGQLN